MVQLGSRLVARPISQRAQNHMGVATTTDTITDSVRRSFEVSKNLCGMSVQVDETAKSKKEGKAAVWETFVGKSNPRIIFYVEQ